MANELPAGWKAGYIAVEVQGDGDTTYWVLDQQQMDEVDLLSGVPGADYNTGMGVVIDKYNLYTARKDHYRSILSALSYMLQNKMVLVEDFSYLTY